MSRTDARSDGKDRSTRANEAQAAAEQAREAEARAKRLEEIRLSVVEEWRWRDPDREE